MAPAGPVYQRQSAGEAGPPPPRGAASQRVGVWLAPALTLLFPPEPQIMHGGLFSEDGVTLDDIRKIERSRQPPDSGAWGQPLPPGARGLQPCPGWALRPRQETARLSLSFLTCNLGQCTSLVRQCWPGSMSVRSTQRSFIYLFVSSPAAPGVT